MADTISTHEPAEDHPEQATDLLREAKWNRRTFVQVLGGGLLFTVTEAISLGQRRSRSGGRSRPTVAARLHVNANGTISVMTGKVEEGQGSRAQLTQAAAEELRVDVAQIQLVMADTALVPDDGITAGSRTTPRTVPAVRQGAAAARELLTELAAQRWNVDPADLLAENGAITHPTTGRKISYAELASADPSLDLFQQPIPPEIALTPVEQWRVIGSSVARPNARDLVTGAHRFPSDIKRSKMLYGKILRPPSYDATLQSIDLSVVEEDPDVVVVRDGQFVGIATPTTHKSEQILAKVAATATWKTAAHPSSQELFAHLKRHSGAGRPQTQGTIERALADAKKTLQSTFEVAYVQHTPMEPRAATAQWQDRTLTVWTGVDGPQRVQADLARALDISVDRVRVIVPDMGGGFGGKHTGEAALEAARLARVAQRPVAVHWTRAEEFTWAYFRPAAVIECQAGLDEDGSLVAWDFKNINAGGSAIDPPYDIPNTRITAVDSQSPLRQGAYRCLAATANNFARESFLDELAAAESRDPREFRLAHLENSRIRKVLEVATEEFHWADRIRKSPANVGVGLACGTEKNSVVAACVEVEVNRPRGTIVVKEVCEAFECGPIQNPANLLSQVQGCIMMGMGPALWEAIEFEEGRISNASFDGYRVPHFLDLPKINVHLVENREIPSAGGGETPIIAIAPAIANAVFAATGLRLRSMPLRLPAAHSA